MEIHLDNPQGEVILRTGAAPALFTRTPLNVSGSIAAPLVYAGFNKNIAEKKHHVVADQHSGFISLIIENEDLSIDVIHGSLSITPEYISLGVNAGRSYTGKDLALHLAKHAAFFPSQEELRKATEFLSNTNVQMQTQIKQADDRRGSNVSTVVHDVKERETDVWQVKCRMRVYRGWDEIDFNIELYRSVTTNQVTYIMESSDVFGYLFTEPLKVIGNQVEQLRALGLCVLMV